MQIAPPHLLLTNYAMLEYLLLRPQDSAFFDGPTATHWRSIVLDEVHVYNGARGTEIGMLLRRVRDRVLESERGRLQCFATSATLGAGEKDYPALAQFASDLFGEDFDWDTNDPHRQDVIGAVRRPLKHDSGAYALPAHVYRKLQATYRQRNASSDMGDVLRAECPEIPCPDTAMTPEAFLWKLLVRDANVGRLHDVFEQGIVDLARAVPKVFVDGGSSQDLVALVDLGVSARRDPSDASLVPARYHFMLRALEGAFVCLAPSHPPGEPALRLARFEHCPSCRRIGALARMFELGVCRRCGAEYLVGALEQRGNTQVLTSASPFDSGVIHLLLGSVIAESDEDELAANLDDDNDVATCALCVGCGAVLDSASETCECPAGTGRVAVALAKQKKRRSGGLRRCLACAGIGNESIVYRFLTGTDAPLSVIATDLYQAIPPSDAAELAERPGQGRKLLVFSDSRQDAAFFAPYLEVTYQRAVQRRLIADAIGALGKDRPRFGDLIQPIREQAESCAVLDPDKGTLTNTTEVKSWLMRELLALDRRQSLDGTGTAELAVAFPKAYRPPQPLLGFGLARRRPQRSAPALARHRSSKRRSERRGERRHPERALRSAEPNDRNPRRTGGKRRSWLDAVQGDESAARSRTARLRTSRNRA